MDKLTGCSPIQHILEFLGAHWGHAGRTPLALHFGDPDAETIAARTLGLCDLSALPKLGVKGKKAAAWLKERGIEVPEDIYEVRSRGVDGIIARIGGNEFLLEDGLKGESDRTGGGVRELSEQLGSAEGGVRGGVYRVERQEATFLLSGVRALEPLAQVCGVDFSEVVAGRLIYTRFAVVSVAVIFAPIDGLPVYRIWVDSTYAEYLWENLSQISAELGGRVVGARWMTKEQ